MKTYVKLFSYLIVILMVAAILLTGCSSGGTEQEQTANTNEANEQGRKVVKLAFLNPLSGNNADAGQQDLNAARLAVEDINNEGGIKALGGAKVELIEADTTSDPTQAQSVAERVFSGNKLAGAVGTGISALTLPILPVAEKHQIPIVTNSISDDITNQGYKYVFEPVPKGSMFGSTQVNFLNFLNDEYDLGLKNVAIVYENSAYGVSTAKGVRDIANNAGLNVVLDQSYPAGFTDASSLVTAIKSSNAQVLFPVSYTTDAKLIVNTMKSMNVDPFVIGGGAGFLWPAMSDELGENVNGMLSVASWNWDSLNISSDPELAKIPQRYEEKYGTFMTEHAGPTYTAVRLLAEAMEKAASDDPVKVREALASLYVSSGPASLMQPGQLKFDSTGWNQYVHPVIIQWQDNKPRTVYPKDDATEKLIIPEGLIKK